MRTAIEDSFPAVAEGLKALEERRFVERLWAQDAGLWSANPAQQALIKNRLGWLASPSFMRERLAELKDFAAEIRRAGFSHVVLLGMGGSSLAPEVFALTFGFKQGSPTLLVLDSTDPAAVKNSLNRVNLAHTLLIVSSKSGTTLEPLAFYKFFRAQVEQIRAEPGPQFVAITDSGTPLERLAKEERFRRVFVNPSTIGGRYSAISYFGLVPAALIGVDLDRLLERAGAMVARSTDRLPLRENPGVVLGAALGAVAKAGRDKVTLLLSPRLQAFGSWVEQLLAESTGKEGRGLIPVDGELPAGPAVYGQDRFFVAVTLDGEAHLDGHLKELQAAGHPVFRITLKDPFDLCAEFFRWEVATATAGALLEVNPFDEPNVQEAKDNTAKLLHASRPGVPRADRTPDSEQDALAAHLAQAKPGDYLALLAYLPSSAEVSVQLQALRSLIRDRLKIATTVGYGPRYLHSTGQLHKGGPGTGLFILITGDDREDLAIPGEPYSFGALKNAQALGDFQALKGRGRRVIRLHVDDKASEILEHLTRVAARAIKAT